eukprot:CAMPEP_0194715050 /NCGR_PEP_ID=MMETSP0296-20130528/6737_1 /TAXON_ID=39354 /ORGANISM="Heterosigma akashiwo, Strain CCMP2393" /LENGTH=145 /DNA_ID=CAMNT_0039614615 /DNA_START=108 /DNA_END=543 /DNA_ORIENTATION=-
MARGGWLPGEPPPLWGAALGCSRAHDEIALIRICHQSQTCQVGGDDRHPPSRACCQGGSFRPSSLTPWAITTSSPMTTEMIEGLVLVWSSFSTAPAAELTFLAAAVSTTALVLHWHRSEDSSIPPSLPSIVMPSDSVAPPDSQEW